MSHLKYLAYTFLVCFLASYSSHAFAQLLNDSANLKILKARTQLLFENKESLEEELDTTAGLGGNVGGRVNCGSVDIGNQISTSSVGQNISIIITGDIINTDNNCNSTNFGQ